MEKDLTIRKLQECIKNIDHKNNMNDKYMLKLMEEVGELAEAVRKNKKMQDDQNIKGRVRLNVGQRMSIHLSAADMVNRILPHSLYIWMS